MGYGTNTTSTVTLLVNGQQAESALDAMKRKAEELAASIQQAQLAGDNLTTKKLQKEFDDLTEQIDNLESSLAGVERVMGDLADENNRSTGIKGVYNKLGQLVSLKLPKWFSEQYPDFKQYFSGLTTLDYQRVYGQLMELSHTYKDGSGTVRIDLRNGKTIELNSLDEIKGMMQRLLSMIETDKQLQARFRDEQNPDKPRKEYKYSEEDEWRRARDAENYIAMSTGQKDYQQYLLDRTHIEQDYLRKKIANWRSTDTEIQQFERQLATLEQKERSLTLRAERQEETRVNRERREEITTEHEKRLAELEQMNQEGKLSYRAYREAVLREDVEYLQKVKQYYKVGSIYRYYVEREINAKIKQEREQKAKELNEAELALRQQYYRTQETRNREDIEHEYEVRRNALSIMYRNMVEQAEGNVKKIEKITKQYNKVMRKEEIAMKKALGEDVTLTWQEKIEAFYEWLGSDDGKKWEKVIGDMTASMGAMFSSVTEMVKLESEIQIAQIEKRYEREISMAEGNQYKVKILERKQAKEIAKEKKAAAQKTFALQVLQAIATTAENAIKAYGDGLAIGGMAGLIMAPIAAGLATAAGMVQIALINKQKNAAGSVGYQRGGFTPDGRADEAVGVVHAGEWVASRKLVQSPVVRPLLVALDAAQRGNVIGTTRLSGAIAPVSSEERLGSRESTASGASTDERVTINDTALAMVAAIEQQQVLQSHMRETLEKLSKRLEMPAPAVVSVTGENGLNQATEAYQRLMNNKSPKRLRR